MKQMLSHSKIPFKGFHERRRLYSNLLKSGYISGIIGSLGVVLIGIFSLDRGGPTNIYHNFIAIFAFGGMIASIMIFSCYILIYKTPIPKIIGIIGLVGPLTSFILWPISNLYLFEWLTFLYGLGLIFSISSILIDYEAIHFKNFYLETSIRINFIIFYYISKFDKIFMDSFNYF